MKKVIAAVVFVGLVTGLGAAQKKKAGGSWKTTPGVYAVFDTSMGTFVAQLLEKEAPETVANFVGLAVGGKEYTDSKDGEAKKGRFFDGLTFHRVVPDYIIQGGDPKGDSTGGPGFEFEDEINGLTFDRPGRLAMANSGKDTNGSQFFVTVVPVDMLNDKKAEDGTVTNHYTIFGQVVDGQKVVDAISRVPATAEKPNAPVTMKKVDILRVDKRGKAAPVTAAAAAPKEKAPPRETAEVKEAAPAETTATAPKEEPAPKKKSSKKGTKKKKKAS